MAAIPLPRPPRGYTYWKNALAQNASIQTRVEAAAARVPTASPKARTAAVLTVAFLAAASNNLAKSKGTVPPARWNALNRRFFMLAAGVFGSSVFHESSGKFVLDNQGVAYASAVAKNAEVLAMDTARAREIGNTPPEEPKDKKGSSLFWGLLLLGGGYGAYKWSQSRGV